MAPDKKLVQRIFFAEEFDFSATALELFRFQYENNEAYGKYVDALGINPGDVNNMELIPFLPIRFFKTHKVTTTTFEPELVFESSGTTETINSKHYVKEASIYELSFMRGFQRFYGNPRDLCIIGLLPSYLDRQNSSLVYMVDRLVKESNHPLSGFYLNEFDELAAIVKKLEDESQNTLLIGVTFALLDFAALYPMPLRNTIIMETGGMKGRRKEMVRQEVHGVLKAAFDTHTIHSEYGMTELLSQAYSKGNGIFESPPWMKILMRDEEDPLTIKKDGGSEGIRGVINVIDLANIYSCSFIATDDLGVAYKDESFEVRGRMDNSDLRGCSLLVV